VFGAHPVSVFFRIALPLTFRGILAGWMMIFIVALRELVAPGLMAPMNTDVVSTFIVNEFEQGDVGLGMCMAVFTMLLTVFLFSGIQYLQCGRKRKSKVPVSPQKNEIQEKK
jgi:iron(III) transport system permease protein